MKENRDRTVNNLRCLNSYNHKADLLPALGNSESYGIGSARYETEGCPLTKEGNTFYLKSVTDMFKLCICDYSCAHLGAIVYTWNVTSMVPSTHLSS
jgi:hypothetical protein